MPVFFFLIDFVFVKIRNSLIVIYLEKSNLHFELLKFDRIFGKNAYCFLNCLQFSKKSYALTK